MKEVSKTDLLRLSTRIEGAGNVYGPGSAVDGNITVFDGTDGKKIKDSGKKVADFLLLSGGTMTGWLNLGGNDLRNEHVITASNGNTYGDYPLGFSYSNIGSTYVQTTGENFPGYGTVLTINQGPFRMYQEWVGHTTLERKFRNYYNGAWQSWAEVWHEGNDGSGSGLDADTLDGYHASSFAPSGYGLGGACQNISNGNIREDRGSGKYMGSNVVNAPDSNWWYFDIFWHNDLYTVVVAYRLNSTSGAPLWCREIGGVWSGWVGLTTAL